MKSFLGIDVGTTSLKAAVFDENGRRLGFRSVDYTLDTDPATGTIEFDAETYADICRHVIEELCGECGKDTTARRKPAGWCAPLQRGSAHP